MNSTAETVNTQRPPASAYIQIGSDDRFAKLPNGQPDYSKQLPPITDFTITPGQNLSIAQPRRFAVIQCYFPYYLPNLTPKNCVLTLRLLNEPAPTTFVIQDPDAYSVIHTGAELAQLVEAEVQANPAYAGTTVVYDQRSSRFTITVNDPTNPIVVLPTPPGNYGGFSTTTDLRHVMGLDTPDLYVNQATYLIDPFGFFKVVLRGGYTTVNQTNYIDICSVRLTQHQSFPDTDTANTGQPVILRLYVPPANGQSQVLLYEPQVPKYIRANPDMFLNAIDIFLRDDQGQIPWFPGSVSFPNVAGLTADKNFPTASGQEFNLTLLVSES